MSKYISVVIAFVLISFFLISCKNDESDFGVDLVNNDALVGVKDSLEVVSYNYYTGDTIRADNKTLERAVVGVYDENIFGKTKADFLTQVRLKLDALNPDFGTNPVVESVVLTIKPSYSVTDAVSSTDGSKITTTYPLTEIVGNIDATMTLDIYSLSESLGGTEDVLYSNSLEDISVEQLLGSVEVTKEIEGVVEYDKEDNTKVISEILPSIKIELDKQYFIDKIINYQGSLELNDNTKFLNYFKGLKFSVQEENGFLFTFNPKDLDLTINYKNDESSESLSYSFDLSSVYNVRNGNYQYERPAGFSDMIINSDKVNGDEKLYLQGMGGPRAIVKIQESDIDRLKNKIEIEKLSIVGAKLKLYPVNNDIPQKPPYIFANQVDLDDSGTISDYYLFSDLSTFGYSTGWFFNPAYSTDREYYELNITQHVYDIIHNSGENKPIVLDVGNFTGTAYSTSANNRAYTPYRQVFYGNNTENKNKLKIEILYTKN
ncbi:MAG: DUF4270 domain-containing protein [Flavobacteriales bacterium]|nr:DUF4270 domain-containing protein [Flavobacteriales bacterium]